MVTTRLSPQNQSAVALAQQFLQRGDPAGAELALTPLFSRGLGSDPGVLHLTGVIRLQQGRFAEATGLLARARAADPRQPHFALTHGIALGRQGLMEEALAAWRAAIKLKPDLTEAYLETANLQQRLGQLDQAAATWRRLLRVAPGHIQAKLSLSAVLIDSGHVEEAETLLRRTLRETLEPRVRSSFHNALAMALRRRSQHAEALEQFEAANALEPAPPFLEIQRAEVLQDLKRYDEAVALMKRALAREPANPHWHQFYNDLLYRLGGGEDYLKSYDRAPRTRDLQFSKAFFLSHERRGEEAHAVYADLVARDPHDRQALAGVANALVMMKRYDEASAAFETALAHDPGNAELFSNAAEAAILRNDPEKAVALCEQGLAVEPANQICLAAISVGYRMMDDARDETLNGYDTLVRSFDLEPPRGFSRMEDFNAELNAALDQVHPQSREYINQSLRGGTQTVAHLFGAGHELVERIRARIDETVARYIAEMPQDAAHPFLSRRAREFRLSRLLVVAAEGLRFSR